MIDFPTFLGPKKFRYPSHNETLKDQSRVVLLPVVPDQDIEFCIINSQKFIRKYSGGTSGRERKQETQGTLRNVADRSSHRMEQRGES